MRLDRPLCLVVVLSLSACSSPTATTDSASAAAKSSAPVPSTAKSAAPAKPSASVASTPSASASPPTPTAPKRKRPTGWKEEWQPYPEEGDNVFEFPDVNVITRKDVPDPKTCPIDGPFWGEGVSYWGTACSESELPGCAEIAQRLYEGGHWECAKAYHGLVCQKDPKLTAPPAGAPPGADYPMVGYPQCPPEKDPRLAWRDKELADPVKKGCFLDHDAKKCMELAAKETDPQKRQRLGQLAAAWE